MGAARERVKVLVVEDDQWIRFLLADLLKELGYEVLEASNGQTGLRLAEDHHPDLVILDLALPETPGVEVLHELQRMEPLRSPRVVITSAHPELLAPDDYESVEAVFTKPYDIQHLQTLVADLTTDVAQKPLGAGPRAAAS
jgi:CheY-like chemotaxis protein